MTPTRCNRAGRGANGPGGRDSGAGPLHHLACSNSPNISLVIAFIKALAMGGSDINYGAISHRH